MSAVAAALIVEGTMIRVSLSAFAASNFTCSFSVN
jgi:hypothetical protein